MALNNPFSKIVGLMVLVFHNHMHRGVGLMVMVSFHKHMHTFWHMGIIVQNRNEYGMHVYVCHRKWKCKNRRALKPGSILHRKEDCFGTLALDANQP